MDIEVPSNRGTVVPFKRWSRSQRLGFVHHAKRDGLLPGQWLAGILKGMSPRIHLGYFALDTPHNRSFAGLPNSGILAPHRSEGVVNYLARTFRLTTVPRLVENNASDACDFSLSGNLQDLFKGFHASHVLLLIFDK